jgi:hypothetical protein
MATNEHATNEQMATIMGWTIGTRQRWLDKRQWRGYTNDPSHYKYFNPQADLNHAALVEARLAELGLTSSYIENILNVLQIDADAYFSAEMTVIYRLVTAPAQTRCDAAWATWQQWKGQQT